MSDDPFPCPFCGCEQIDIKDHKGTDDDPRTGRIAVCRESTCHAYMFNANVVDKPTREQVDASLIARWNRRAPGPL